MLIQALYINYCLRQSGLGTRLSYFLILYIEIIILEISSPL